MQYIDLGIWSIYQPANPPVLGAVYYTNFAGQDWYRDFAHNPARPKGVVFLLDENLRAEMVYGDLDQVHPANRRVIVIPTFDPSREAREAVVKGNNQFDLATGTFFPIYPASQ